MNEEGNPLGLNYTPTIGDAVQGIQDYGRTVISFWGGAVKAVPQALTTVSYTHLTLPTKA